MTLSLQKSASPIDLKWVWALGILIGLFLGRFCVRTHPFSFDSKMFYVGAHIFRAGGNAYDQKLLLQTSKRVAPEGLPAGGPGLLQLHLPATLLATVPFSFLPWSLFCWGLAIANGLAVAFIALWGWEMAAPHEVTPLRWLFTAAFLTVLPSTWQNFALGQLGLYVAAALFYIWHLTRTSDTARKEISIGPPIFLAWLKFTLSLPHLLWIAATGDRNLRRGLAWATLIFCVLNTLGVLLIGPQQFFPAYRSALAGAFDAGHFNDAAKGARIDLENLKTLGFSVSLVKIFKIGWAALLFGAAWRAAKRLQTGHLFASNLEVFTLLGAATLLLFYHRSYDLPLLYPAIFLAISWWFASFRLLAITMAGLFALVLGCVGSPSPLDCLLFPIGLALPTAAATLALMLVALWLSVRCFRFS